MAKTWRAPRTDRPQRHRKQKKPNLKQQYLQNRTEDLGNFREIRMRDHEQSN